MLFMRDYILSNLINQRAGGILLSNEQETTNNPPTQIGNVFALS